VLYSGWAVEFMTPEREIRLLEEEIEKIKNIAREVFGDDIEIYIFGSRAQSNKKGRC
jgi:predicted nucleotidyltransferase